jgi:hypothetical protein
MFVSRVLAPVVALVSLLFLAGACGGDSDSGVPGGDAPGPGATDESIGDGPASSGLVVADTFLTFEGQRYQLQDTLQADLTTDEFTVVGVASEADIEHDGELAVYGRAGDDTAIYTFSLALDEEGEEADVPALWLKWEPVK